MWKAGIFAFNYQGAKFQLSQFSDQFNNFYRSIEENTNFLFQPVHFFNKSEIEMTLPLPYRYQNSSSRLETDAKLFVKILFAFLYF